MSAQLKSKILLALITLLLISTASAEIKQKLNIPYGTDPKQVIDVFWDDSKQDQAIVVNVHGGGWTSGDKNNFGGVDKAEYFAKLGCILVAPNYRLIKDREKDKKEIYQIVDNWMAVAYIRRHASEFNANPDKIIMAGGSAGGHLAAAVSYDQSRNWLKDTKYDGDMDAITKSIKGFWGESPAVYKFMGGNPMDNIDKNDPPAFLSGGSADGVVTEKEVRGFADKLEENKIKSVVLYFKGGFHMYGRELMWNTWEQAKPGVKTKAENEATYNAWRSQIRDGIAEFITDALK